MKKIISLMLCIVMLMLTFSMMFTSSAVSVSINAGEDALVAQWQKGESHGFDYRYYSPVKSSSDTTKYPLVVLLHGRTSGTHDGEQVTSSDFFYWSSSEYQARFKDAGGAYILMPRTPGGDVNTWDKTSYHSDLMDLISDFMRTNATNIDTERIYLGGWSLGGAGAVSVASKYNDFFAAVIIMAPFDSVSQDQVSKMKNTPIWLVTCTQDLTASYITFAKPFWNKIRDTSNIPSHCRITTFDKYNYYDTSHHHVHHAVAQDLLNQPGDCGMKTEDAKGNRIYTSESESIITWLSEHRLGQAEDEDPCRCDCHSEKGWTKFIWAIKCFFYRIFSPSRKTCDCGAKHW